jgi:hypothetical protein
LSHCALQTTIVKAYVREILTDLKAAVRIGDPDSLYTILEQIRGLSEEELPTTALQQLGLPLYRLPTKELKSLARDASPVVRALAAAALASRFARNPVNLENELTRLGGDKSPEVRQILVQTLMQEGAPPERLVPLAKDWTGAEKPGLQTCGLQILPSSRISADTFEGLLHPLAESPDYEVRGALVECLSALAQAGYAASVMSLLQEWARQEEPNIWVITRALSASWALNQSAQALSILKILSEKKGALRSIERAAARHESRA